MRTKKLFAPNPRRNLFAGIVLLVLLSSGCAITPPAPTSTLSAAQQAITNAERSEAQRYAGAELDDARRRLQMAQSAVRSEKMIEAERYAEESKIAAELASAATETSKALESNQELSRSVRALIEEMRRTGDQQ